jgi:hypothetical protein
VTTGLDSSTPSPLLQVWQKDVPGARDVTAFPFLGRTGAEHLQAPQPGLYLVHAHLRDLGERKPGVIPRAHVAGEVAGKPRAPGAHEELNPMDHVIGIMFVIAVIGLLADKLLLSPWERFLHRRWGTGLTR